MGASSVEVGWPSVTSSQASRPLESRLFVPGRGACFFSLEAGFSASVIDTEGLQSALLIIAHGEARVTGVPHPTLAPIESLLDFARTFCDEDGRSIVAAAVSSGFVPGSAYRLFADAGPPGRRASFEISASTRCLVLAPGSAMQPQDQLPATSLEILVGTRLIEPPAPLAPPILDVRVPAASATAYRVAAGEYIQIVDIDGKQCSDFIAFDAAELALGREWGIDSTATRTLLGQTAATPGLHSKYFDARLKPLVEVVRDTVGRHDAFMLACTAKYYDDMGYPGHDNCTDNFNRAIKPFGIAPRAGWPAINFFYNTFVRPDGSVGSDEPWSRPGDYVLLRALTDLVCASSSCADDIDPANGWEPTDIQVRVYDKTAGFSKGNAIRMTPDSAPELTRKSGFDARTSALTPFSRRLQRFLVTQFICCQRAY